MKKPSLFLLLLTASAFALEAPKLPLEVGTLKTREGKVLENAKIVGSDAVGVKVVHAGGTARLTYDRLPKELAARFPRDPEAAKKQLEKEAREGAEHDRTVDKAVAKNEQEENAEEDSPLEGAPELKGDAKAKIASLNAYISRLEAGIRKARQTAADARERAATYRSTATTYVTRTDGKGNVRQDTVTNGSRLNRADFQDKRATREEGKIAQAESLIVSAREQLDSLGAQVK